LGIGYEELRAVNPRLVYCSISAYGEEGPLRDRPGQDLVVQGYSGSMWSVGSASDPPAPGALWAIDAMTAYQATIGILAALRERETSNLGQKVEVNMLSVAMDCQVQELTTYLNLGVEPVRTGGRFAHAFVTAPYSVYPTKDSWIVLAQAPLDQLGKAVGNDRLAEMTDWSAGIDFRDEVYAILMQVMPTRTTAEWLEIMDSYRLWAGPVYRYSDLVREPHVTATGMIVEVTHPRYGSLKVPNVPIRFSRSDASVRTPPPELGEHSAEVLHELLGIDEAGLKALEQAGAIQTRDRGAANAYE
jgi:crotonobetainyl-CoA:carnitine CoA-transferase CaiB-like acyl-CoA transferase